MYKFFLQPAAWVLRSHTAVRTDAAAAVARAVGSHSAWKQQESVPWFGSSAVGVGQGMLRGLAAAVGVAAAGTTLAVAEGGSSDAAPKADASNYSEQSKQVLMVVSMLQQIFVGNLESLRRAGADGSKDADVAGESFKPVGWVRDGGLHGGGVRLQTIDSPVFNRASVNVSAVHYEDKEKYVYPFYPFLKQLRCTVYEIAPGHTLPR